MTSSTEAEAARLRLPPGFHIRAFDSVGSTNDEAKALARSGAGEGTVVWARRQESGRGRRGRAWSSPEGNLYSSVILRPARPPGTAAQISFLAALAIAETAESVLPDPDGVRCKWPNDVLVRDRKLSGILLESEQGSDGDVAWLVLGVGINLRHFPATSGYEATSLIAEGAPQMAAGDLLEIYLGHLSVWYSCWLAHGFAPLRQAWLDRARGLGQPILVRLADRTIPGTFADLDSDGVLLLDPTDGGPRQRIAAGDVFFPGPPTG
ncbi:biotin--[acetyl-CoA-carboxylase] ligase [Azospirillum picis]|uniref:biotin--[biotin carboxyl-carrier protein] ligase n=1 Tax=Azospirillum picis TaxID=488438 RepID=A0ABU0MIN7_9PROT|nr:biotin--[acetyl-CoA-carboxylase] ligase [Azospirillum picis]MBP2299543.1 BirA family biotin operon repressor/biotin-[acetyl-CoA-carboxylase] ligase [Azospirillum picis]MDQ0533330.1 BirA family biotin operon repressor/biotin-[acetyl-CoA-carboxylase] ligase [Azospirillum picis]